PRQARGESDHRTAHAVPDVDRGDAARPVVEVRAADADVLYGLQAVAAGKRLVAEVVHASARFHDERAAPRARVVDAGAVSAAGANPGEAVAGRASLFRASEFAELGRVRQFRTQEAETRRHLIPLRQLEVEFRVERVGRLHTRVVDLIVRLSRR